MWQIVLDRPVTGDLTLAVDCGQTFSVPTSNGNRAAGKDAPVTAESDAAQAGPPIAVPVLVLQDVSRQSGMVAVEAAGDQQIDDHPENLRAVDPADVFKPKAYVPRQRIVAAYQYQHLPYRLTISATRHASEPVLAGICEAAEIVSVVGQEGRTRHQARFSLRNLNLQQVPVTLPESANLWSVTLDNEPVEVRRNQGTYLVPLPATQAASVNEARELSLLYETDSPRANSGGFWGQLRTEIIRHRAPEISMPTLSTTWYVHPPDGADWVSADGDFRPETPPTRPTLVTGLAESIARRGTGALPWKFGGLIAAVIVAVVCALVRTGKGCGFSLLELLVVIAVIGILIALLLPATQSAREAARRSQCNNNLKNIGLGLHNYHEVYGQFPPAAIGPPDVPRERQFSWMVAILPFMEQRNLYEKLRLDLPCDDPHNAPLLQNAFPEWLCCPSDPAPMATPGGFRKTSYVAITGIRPTPGFRTTRGVIGLDRGLRLEEITDGTSNTIMVAEVTDGGPWFAGGAGTARRIDEWIERKTWSHHPGGGLVLMADASVQFIHSTTDPQMLRRLAVAQDGQTVKLDGGEDTAARSGAATGPPPPASLAPAPPAKEQEEAEPLAPAPEPPKEELPVQVPPQSRVEGGERARLSLRVAIERPESPAIRFQREGGAGELVLGLQDRTFAATLQWLVFSAAVLAAWAGRRRSKARRGIALVAGLALPIGLSGLVPLAWTPVLDGLLLGALAGAGLWIILRVIAAIRMSVPGATAAAMVIAIGLLFALEASVAEEKVPASKGHVSTEQIRQRDLTLYIPYAPAKEDPLQNTQVYLPHDEFLRLWKLAHPEKPDAAPPDVPAIVSHAEYVGRIQGDVARFDGRLVIHQLVERWLPVTLPLGRVALEKIEINGQPATLAGDGPAGERSARVSGERSARVSGERSAGVSDPAETADRRSPAPKETSGQPSGSVRKPATAPQPTPMTARLVSPPAGDQPAIYLRERGLHVVDVRFSVPVSRLGATGQMTVPLRPVATGCLRFLLPADDLEVQVGGCPGGWRRDVLRTDKKSTVKSNAADRSDATTEVDTRLWRAMLPEAAGGEFISIPLGAADDLSIRWQPRRVEMRQGQLISVDHALMIDVLDSGVHLHSQLHYQVQQGAVRELQLRIPAGVAVQRVDGAEVADWSIETVPAAGTDPGQQRLVVSLKTELTAGANLDIQAIRRDRQVTGDIDIHAIEPLGVARETGRIAIGCSSHYRVRVGQAEQLDQIDRAGLDFSAAGDRSPSRLGLCPDPVPPAGTESQPTNDGCAFLSAYRYTSRPWRLQLLVEHQQPQVAVFDRTALAVTSRQATLRSLLTVRVTGAPVPAFVIRLPSLLRASQVRVPPGAEWFLDRDDKGQRLKVELQEPAIGRLDLAVSGTLTRDSTQAEFAVPGVRMEEVQAQRGQLAVYLDDDLEAVVTKHSGVRPIDPAALESVLRPEGNRPVRYAFEFASPPDDLRLRLSPAASRCNGDVTTIVSVREGAVAYISEVNFEVRQAGRSKFQIATPDWLGDDVDVQGDQIRQVRSRAADAWRTWDIELQQPVRGTYRLHLIQTLPLSDDGTVSGPVIRLADVERSRSHLVVENLTGDEIATSAIRGAAPISIAEVPGTLADPVRRQAVAAYRITGDDAVLTWKRQVRQQETGLAATITLADLTTVILADGRYRARAAYNIRNWTLQFLELELPRDSQVWSLHVSGQPVRPATVRRQGRPITLLPLQKTSAGDFSSKVVLIYAGQLGSPLGRWTQVRPPAPQILSGVPVSRTLWTVLLPPEYGVRMVSRGSNLEEVAAAYQQEERKLSFLDELREVVQVASSKGKSAARTKAWYSLKQIGSELQDYAQETGQVGAPIAADVQQQAQQIEAEIKRLEELKPDTRRADDEAAWYFGRERTEPEGVQPIGDLDRGLEMIFDRDLDRREAGKAAPKEDVKKLPGQDLDGSEERRGDLRKQAAEQLAKLKTTQQEGAAPASKTTPEQAPELPKAEPKKAAAGSPPAVDEPAAEPSPAEGQAPPSAPADSTATGRLSMDLDLALAATPYHFRKLHGDPRLVLHARHEDLTRALAAVIWAALCLALAIAVIQVLRRPNAAALAQRYWPWLTAVIGTAWLFLLPAGVCGLALVMAASYVLIARLRTPGHARDHGHNLGTRAASG